MPVKRRQNLAETDKEIILQRGTVRKCFRQ